MFPTESKLFSYTMISFGEDGTLNFSFVVLCAAQFSQSSEGKKTSLNPHPQLFIVSRVVPLIASNLVNLFGFLLRINYYRK